MNTMVDNEQPGSESTRRISHEPRPEVMHEGSVGTCHFCGCIIRFETRFFRNKRRIVVLSQTKRRGLHSKRSRWERHKCPVARSRERQRRAGYASEIRE